MAERTVPFPDRITKRLEALLRVLYPKEVARSTLARLVERMDAFRQQCPELGEAGPDERMDERDVILITYGDQIREPGKAPLRTLGEVLTHHAGGTITGMHLLPFFPYSSDDGFSVIDYFEVDPALGDWSDVERLDEPFRLMFDAVINHISRSSEWFQGFLEEDPFYQKFFIVVDPETDLSAVTRPRALPLLTPVETGSGTRHVWTTFSPDQVDLNYQNPEVLLEITDVLLFYVARGAEIIRLDAIAYLWKEVGTACIHLDHTHYVIQLWRAVLDAVAPRTLILTETNVPHNENVSYFGDGTNEAQLVYQFPLAPLILHTFHTGNATHLQAWAANLTLPSDQVAYFNFLASHDGIGLRPVEGILKEEAVNALADLVQRHGGYISYRTNPDGSQSPYELNINYFDALNDPASTEPRARQVDRFIASQAILLALQGVPGIYVHSLFGSRGWPEGVEQTGQKRTINREKFDRAALERALADPATLRHQIFHRYRDLIRARIAERAFHPEGAQKILVADPALFSFLRTAPDGTSRVLCLHEIAGGTRQIEIDLSASGIPPGATLQDLLTEIEVTVNGSGRLALTVEPYDVYWLRHR